MNAFGDKLKELRDSQQLSLMAAAQKLSIPQSRLHELEIGVRIPTDTQIDRIEQLFGLSAGELKQLMPQFESA